MIEIIFEAHSTTTDNEAKLASGHNDVELSELGVQQSYELGMRRGNEHFDAIFCSDLQRSYKTAELAFGNSYPIVRDARLRECDYGEYTQKSKEFVDGQKLSHVSNAFPAGESYEDTARRMKEFLDDLREHYEGKRVMIIGHRATQYGLEHWLHDIPLEDIVVAPWKWQPGWRYIVR